MVVFYVTPSWISMRITSPCEKIYTLFFLDNLLKMYFLNNNNVSTVEFPCQVSCVEK